MTGKKSGAAAGASGRQVARAVAVLRAGGVVAFPTETVYGLGGAVANPRAIQKIYALKGRPKNHPLIVHIASAGEAEQYAAAIPPAARRLMRAFMPGALTLLLPRGAGAPAAVCGGGNTVALRAPAHPLAQKLLRAFGGALAAPSANRFGGVSPTCAAHIRREWGRALPLVDGGACPIGIESTIVGFAADGAPFIARPGNIGAARIAAVGGRALAPPPPNLRAPGALPRHYAPQKPLRLASPAALAACGGQSAALCRRRPPAVPPALWRRAPAQPHLYARRLYAFLRSLDSMAAAREIVVERPPNTAAWRAVNDRLQRAAAGGGGEAL